MTPPPPPIDLDVTTALGAKTINQVLEVLDVPTLVRTDRDALYVFVDCRGHHFVDRSVVTEVDDFGALSLQ